MTGPQAIAEVKRLSPAEGDVLVFRLSQDDPQSRQSIWTAAKVIDDGLKRQGKNNVLCVVLSPDQSVECLNEEAMRLNGWVKIQSSTYAV